MSGKFSNSVESRPRTPPPTGPIIELRSREAIFAILIFFLLAVVVGLIVVLGSKTLNEIEAESQRKHNETYYQLTKDKLGRKSCSGVADKLKIHINESFNPCEDFWNYACGGFLSRTEIPEGKKSYGLDDEAKINTRLHVVEAIRSNISRNYERSSERKMKQFYRNCLTANQLGGAGIEAFDEILKSAGGWLNVGKSRRRKYSQWKLLKTLNIDFDISALFSLNVVKDEEAENENILQIIPGNLGVPKYEKYQDESSPLMIAYKKYMEEVSLEVLTSRKTNFSSKIKLNVTRVVHRTFNFERSIAMLRNPDSGESQRNDKTEIKSNISHFISVFNILSRKNWLRFLQSFSSSINESTEVIVADWDYFQNLSLLWHNTKKETRQHYLGWLFMMKFASPLLTPQLRNLTDTFNREMDGKTKDPEEECLEMTKEWFEEVVGAEYVKRVNQSLHLSLASVREMTENVKKIFHMTIEENTWMDNETKAEAFKKLSTLKSIVGFPENMGDDDKLDDLFANVDIPNSSTYFENMVSLKMNAKQERVQSFVENNQDEVWLMSSYENNAYYSFTENIVGYPAGLFQAPFYYENACSFINYGSLATTIAHEMLHAFDSTGCRYDHKGNNRFWWNNSSFNEFMQKTNCVKDAYSVLYVDGIPVNGEKTVDENMADIGGVILAFKAYKLWEEKNGKEEMKELDSMGDLTNEKLFFVAFAQNWCKKRRPENIKKFMKESFHSIEEIRVRGTLSQVKEFGKAFGCSSKSSMAPADRCSVW